MAEQFLTVEQAATRLHIHPMTVRRHLRRGTLRGMKQGKLWRVAESALNVPNPIIADPQTIADTLWQDITSGDDQKRDAAISALIIAPEAVREIVTARSGAAAARYYATPQGQEEWEELADWRALDGEPFYGFEEEDEEEQSA